MSRLSRGKEQLRTLLAKTEPPGKNTPSSQVKNLPS
jgi:hypothetical protein